MNPRHLFMAAVLGVVAQDAPVRRKPLTALQLTSIDHKATTARQRYDSASQRFVNYNPDGRISYRPQRRDFLLAWTAPDGRRDTASVELANRVSATVAASVTFDSLARLYTYEYTIANVGPDSQRLQTVYVEGGGILRAETPDAGWYSRTLTTYLREALGMSDGWALSEISPSGGLAIGGAPAVFRLVSARPPSVVRVVVAGNRRTPSARSDLPDELHTALDAVAYRLPAGVTIGPDPSPKIEASTMQLQRLIDNLQNAREAGWLSHGASAALQKKLLSAKSAVGRPRQLKQEVQGARSLVREFPASAATSEIRSLALLRLSLIPN